MGFHRIHFSAQLFSLFFLDRIDIDMDIEFLSDTIQIT